MATIRAKCGGMVYDGAYIITIIMNKADVIAEIDSFLEGFRLIVGRMYGAAWPLPEALDHRKTRLSQTVALMYDYGISGQALPGCDLGNGLLNDDFADAEVTLTAAVQSGVLLELDAVREPELALKVARAAVARHVLEGGTRHRILSEALPLSGFLTIGEIALLANMDEGSVRNAANPIRPDALAVGPRQKRSYVAVTEARRWLAGRRGFVPTNFSSPGQQPDLPEDAVLSASTLAAVRARAHAAGLTAEAWLQQHLA